MAKTSQINRNKKREKMVAQYAPKRAALKAKAEDMRVPPEERFAARMKLAKLPRNSSPSAHPSSLRIERAFQGLLPQAEGLAHRARAIWRISARFRA